jgi:hypothetical protein
MIIMRVCSAQRTFAEQLETMELSPEQKAKVPPRPLPSPSPLPHLDHPIPQSRLNDSCTLPAISSDKLGRLHGPFRALASEYI